MARRLHRAGAWCREVGKKGMLRIERSSKRGVVFSLTGRIETQDVAELQRLLSLEAAGQSIAFDLQDVTLVDREAVKSLACWESEGIELENCPAYVRDCIDRRRKLEEPTNALNGERWCPADRLIVKRGGL
jgi:hypothetical protein